MIKYRIYNDDDLYSFFIASNPKTKNDKITEKITDSHKSLDNNQLEDGVVKTVTEQNTPGQNNYVEENKFNLKRAKTYQEDSGITQTCLINKPVNGIAKQKTIIGKPPSEYFNLNKDKDIKTPNPINETEISFVSMTKSIKPHNSTNESAKFYKDESKIIDKYKTKINEKEIKDEKTLNDPPSIFLGALIV